MKWFKFYGQDFITDPKMGFLSTAQRLMWVYLLAMASQSEKRDGILKFISLDHLRMIAGISTEDENWKATDKTLELFAEMKLITIIDEFTIKITNYENYQEKELTNAERQERYRLKKQISNEIVTPILQQGNARIDKNRIDKNKEKNIEKKNTTSSSFNSLTEEVFVKVAEDYKVSLPFVKSKADDLKNWCASKGKTYKDYPAALRNWVKRDAEKIKPVQRIISNPVPYVNVIAPDLSEKIRQAKEQLLQKSLSKGII